MKVEETLRVACAPRVCIAPSLPCARHCTRAAFDTTYSYQQTVPELVQGWRTCDGLGGWARPTRFPRLQLIHSEEGTNAQSVSWCGRVQMSMLVQPSHSADGSPSP
jgi:hypothetical protein